jgi:hypothetical protein
MANTQIQPAPHQYVDRLVVGWGSNTTLTISAGQARGGNNDADLHLYPGITVDASVNGANGLDTGSLANSTFYYVYAIGSSALNENATATGAQSTSDAAGLISLSATSPTMPSGYDTYKLIGYALTDGSAHFLKFYTAMTSATRIHYWDSAISVLAGGSATSLTAVSCAAAAPPVSGLMLKLNVQFTPATANDKVSLAVFGSTATTLPAVIGSVATKINSSEMNIPGVVDSGAVKFQYINSAASGATTILVAGFQYSV